MTGSEAIHLLEEHPILVNGNEYRHAHVSAHHRYLQYRPRLPSQSKGAVHYEVWTSPNDRLYVRLDIEPETVSRDAVKQRLGVRCFQNNFGELDLANATPDAVRTFVQEKLSKVVTDYEPLLKALEDEYERTGRISATPVPMTTGAFPACAGQGAVGYR